ncbi:MAG TPA: S8 family serine peptidase [Anaerolineaceae bacterium]
MTDDSLRPAWSNQFAPGTLREVVPADLFAAITPEWAWGGADGSGVRVAVVDSGVEAAHPALKGCVKAGVGFEFDDPAPDHVRLEEDNPPTDLAGHGTACAGIIHSLAPRAEIYSVRVLGRDMRGKAYQFAAGLRWAVEHGMQVVNLSLSTSREEYFALFHKLADQAYFSSVVLVSAANNLPVASYPSLYSSVVSVAARDGHDPYAYQYNPSPPVEFGAPGIDVDVAWLDGQRTTITGNSFAAPHMAGIAARILSKHPGMTPFQVKTVLMACAANVRPAAS